MLRKWITYMYMSILFETTVHYCKNNIDIIKTLFTSAMIQYIKYNWQKILIAKLLSLFFFTHATASVYRHYSLCRQVNLHPDTKHHTEESNTTSNYVTSTIYTHIYATKLHKSGVGQNRSHPRSWPARKCSLSSSHLHRTSSCRCSD